MSETQIDTRPCRQRWNAPTQHLETALLHSPSTDGKPTTEERVGFPTTENPHHHNACHELSSNGTENGHSSRICG